MDDLSAKINQVLSSEEGMKQLQAVASMLTGGGSSGNSSAPSGAAGDGGSGGFDLSSLGNILSQFQPAADSSSPPASTPSSGGFDMSALGNILSQFTSGGNSDPAGPPANTGSGGLDLSGLSSLLGGGQNGGNSLLGNIDLGMIMKLQKVFSSIQLEDENVCLLRALKPHLKEQNRKKVDDAIRIMQLISVLPLIKETGLFGGGLF